MLVDLAYIAEIIDAIAVNGLKDYMSLSAMDRQDS